MKKASLMSIILLLAVMMTACNNNIVTSNEEGKLTVVTTLFPQYDFTKAIGGEYVDVSILLPPGVEAHSYEPTPQDIVSIQKSDLFIYSGIIMEPWIDRVLKQVKSDKLMILDTSEGIELLDHEQEVGDSHDGEAGAKDPHYWLDPIIAEQMVGQIVKALSEADPVHKEIYEQNAAAYQDELDSLNERFVETFKKVTYDTIIYGGHFTFGYFVKRYGLKYVSPYSGFSPDAEPSPQSITDLIKVMEKTGQKVIYYEELVSPKVAQVISDETGADMLLLHGAHNVTKEELDAGVTYLSIMEDNLEKLKIGLGYHE